MPRARSRLRMMERSSIQPRIDHLLSAVPGRSRVSIPDLSALDVWAFLLPAIAFLEIHVVGQLIVSEVIALALLPWLLRSRDRLDVPRWLMALWGAWLASQILTDIIVHSAFTDWARGWAAIVFTMVDVLAVATLAATPRRARIFAFGLAAGGILGYVFAPSPFAASDPWKWAFAGPAAFALAAGLSSAVALRRPWIAVVAFAAFGWLNAVFLFRSLSGVALLTAVYLLAGIVVYGRRRFESPTTGRALAGIAFYGVAAVAVFLTLNVAASMDLLGGAAKVKFDVQSGANAATTAPSPATGNAPSIAPAAPGNPLAVLLAGRSEILASPRAIWDSPIIGHGSWAKDPKYAQLQVEGLVDLGVVEPDLVVDPNLIPTHSYLLGSWVWAGLAGGLFWMGVVALALFVIASLYTQRLAIIPLIAFATTLLLWEIVFSPYGNEARLHAAFGIAMVLLGLRLTRSQGAPGAADDACPERRVTWPRWPRRPRRRDRGRIRDSHLGRHSVVQFRSLPGNRSTQCPRTGTAPARGHRAGWRLHGWFARGPASVRRRRRLAIDARQRSIECAEPCDQPCDG